MAQVNLIELYWLHFVRGINKLAPILGRQQLNDKKTKHISSLRTK